MNETLIYIYSQNSENHALNKSLTLINIISGKFNHSIGIKSLNIDVVNIDMNFNYVYIRHATRSLSVPSRRFHHRPIPRTADYTPQEGCW